MVGWRRLVELVARALALDEVVEPLDLVAHGARRVARARKGHLSEEGDEVGRAADADGDLRGVVARELLLLLHDGHLRRVAVRGAELVLLVRERELHLLLLGLARGGELARRPSSDATSARTTSSSSHRRTLSGSARSARAAARASMPR